MAYGIDDSNKQKVPVYSKDETDGAFATKQEVQNGYAPKNHARDTSAYGLGTGTVYGHVKLGAIPGRSPSANGIALDQPSGAALYELVQRALLNPQVPIGGIVVHATAGSAALIADLYGYGRWEYVADVRGKKREGSVDIDVTIGFAYKRVM